MNKKPNETQKSDDGQQPKSSAPTAGSVPKADSERLKNECCEKCIYWKFLSWSSYHIPNDKDGYRYGFCRRFPPNLPQNNDDIENDTNATYPITLDWNWCGEFKPL